jgi:hypothetical protein
MSTEADRLRDLIAAAERRQAAADRTIARLQHQRTAALLRGDGAEDVLRIDDSITEAGRVKVIEADRIKLVRERLKEIVTDFPIDGAELLARIGELEAREKVLQAKRPTDRSAADDHDLDNIGRRLFEMRKRARVMGVLSGEAA